LALNGLKAKRRILLSGTPFQNNLLEFHALVDFCNPGLLGTPEKFKKIFATPIEKSRDAHCRPDQKKLGEDRAAELYNATQEFMLRRTQEVLERFLPPRNDVVLFCLPTQLQSTLYKAYICSDEVDDLLHAGALAAAFVCITLLKKLCNHPQLLLLAPHVKATDTAEDDPEDETQQQIHRAAKKTLLKLFPSEITADNHCPQYSGKLSVLTELLACVKRTTTDRVIVVSFFKQTLEILQRLCQSCGYPFLRLDGDTPPKARQDLVDKFNTPNNPYFVFLLSTKAGGEGLNLIGANRLVIYDCEWNPSYERQAMARIWRDGQKKEVFIYRLLTTGTIEEKIFQRQMVKQAMSAKIISAESNDENFASEDLADIFSFSEDTSCDTYTLLHSKKPKTSDKKVVDALKGWAYLSETEKTTDKILHELPTKAVSFVFWKTTKPDVQLPMQLLDDEDEEAMLVDDD